MCARTQAEDLDAAPGARQLGLPNVRRGIIQSTLWIGTKGGRERAGSIKGDYVPRIDLGGEAAFRDGIAALHAQGGRI